MIYLGKGKLKLEKCEPCLRSCWTCNPGHKHLKNAKALHWCYACERFWILGKDLRDIKGNRGFDALMRKNGVKVGESTLKKAVK